MRLPRAHGYVHSRRPAPRDVTCVALSRGLSKACGCGRCVAAGTFCTIHAMCRAVCGCLDPRTADVIHTPCAQADRAAAHLNVSVAQLRAFVRLAAHAQQGPPLVAAMRACHDAAVLSHKKRCLRRALRQWVTHASAAWTQQVRFGTWNGFVGLWFAPRRCLAEIDHSVTT